MGGAAALRVSEVPLEVLGDCCGPRVPRPSLPTAARRSSSARPARLTQLLLCPPSRLLYLAGYKDSTTPTSPPPPLSAMGNICPSCCGGEGTPEAKEDGRPGPSARSAGGAGPGSGPGAYPLPKFDDKPPPPPPPKDPGYPVYVGKYDYDSRTDDDLSFKKGDLLYIISTDEGDWWFARAKDSNREGYIPSNYVAEWKSLDAEE